VTRYRASCHCGNVAIEFEADIQGALSCNCSICSKGGALLTFVPRDAVKLEAGPDAMTTYTFNKHVIQHKFCKTCGIKVFGEGADPKGNKIAAINVRCVDGLEFDQLPVQHYDGRSL
jgi:hypothetical protein